MKGVKKLRVYQRGSLICEWLFLPKFKKAIKRVNGDEVIVDFEKAYSICQKIVKHWKTKNEAKLDLVGDIDFFISVPKRQDIKLSINLKTAEVHS